LQPNIQIKYVFRTIGEVKNDMLLVAGIDVGIYTEDFRNEYMPLTDVARL
jgi:hypothetical protein